jgi:hypothetical protein
VTGTEEQSDRQREITAVILKILGVAVAIGLVIGIGAWVMVKAIGLDSNGGTSSGPSDLRSIDPLPTTALPEPSGSAPTSADTGLATPTPVAGDLSLTAAPVMVRPMERINLTGSWPGHDNESLLVQRLEGDTWADFGVDVNVKLGTFATYVKTGRPGDQRFRVFDPASQKASNEVTVTIG